MDVPSGSAPVGHGCPHEHVCSQDFEGLSEDDNREKHINENFTGLSRDFGDFVYVFFSHKERPPKDNKILPPTQYRENPTNLSMFMCLLALMDVTLMSHDPGMSAGNMLSLPKISSSGLFVWFRTLLFRSVLARGGSPAILAHVLMTSRALKFLDP